jgi:hypothetical protein
MRNPFRYFNSSPEVIRLTVMMYIRYPLSLRQVEDILFERGIDISHETVRFWWNRFTLVDGEDVDLWSARDALVLKALTIVLANHLTPSPRRSDGFQFLVPATKG